MNLATSITALVGALIIVVGFATWYNSKRSVEGRSFLFLTIFVALWIAGNLIYNWPGAGDLRYGVALFSYAAAMSMATQIYSFSLIFKKGKLSPFDKRLVWAGHLAAVLSAIPGLIAYGVNGVSIMTHTVFLAFYGGILTAYLLSALYVLISVIRFGAKTRRLQATSIVKGIIGAMLVGLVFNLVFPILGVYDYTIIGPSGAGLFIFAVSYSIVKNNLFDIRLAVVRSVSYAASMATLATLYFFVILVLSSWFLHKPVDTTVSIYIVVSLISALIFQPVKRFFDKVTSRVFYRNTYDTDTFFANLNRLLAQTSDLRFLLERVAVEINNTLNGGQAFFFVYTASGTRDGSYITAGTVKHSRVPVADIRALDGYVFSGGGAPILVDQIDSIDSSLHRLLMSHRIAIALPLVKDKVVVGYFMLGDRRSGGYQARDIRLLATISGELIIAIENALSIQQIKQLNANLQQRIDSATSELRASNAQLHRLDEAKDEFVSMASHQLRTPLTSVKGYISMVLEGDAGKITPMQKHLLNEAFISSERMVHLISDFLNVSRLQTGKFLIDTRPINLAKLVDEELDGLATNASSRNLKFAYTAPKKFPMLELDEGKMRQVIMNFADNAIYYSKEGMTIEVALKIEGDRCQFTVKDKGIGVPASEQAQLFTKFYRATNARRQRPDGTGVGLFLAKKVINAHGGNVIFESEEGKGSTFGFSLPLKPIKRR